MTAPIPDTPPIVTPADQPHVVGATQVQLVTGTHTGAPIGIIDYTIAPGFAPPPILHRHTREDAGVLVLSGNLEYHFADGTTFCAGPGDSVVLPKGCWFRWANASQHDPARAIGWFSPAGFEQFFPEVVEAMNQHAEAGGSMQTFAPTLGEIRARYGDEAHPDTPPLVQNAKSGAPQRS